MRFESSITSVSWIPSDAVEGMFKMPFQLGMAHYDEPLPDVLRDIDAWGKADLFREANELRAFIEVENGRIVDHGHLGRGHIGVTRLRVGPKTLTVPAVAMPLLRPEPEVGPTSVRFVQTAGGRTGMPAPRPVPRKPFFQIDSAIAWTTLSLTIHADGRSETKLVGASPFPRHWIYDHSGKLVAKSGLIDSRTWLNDAFGERTPWGDYDSQAVTMAAETSLERELSYLVMHTKPGPRIKDLARGKVLLEQGQTGGEMYLLLDGVLAVEVDGKVVAQVGPGAILGERAQLEGGRRTATLRAETRCKAAEFESTLVSAPEMVEIAGGHRREEVPT
ncbi:MAG TPA: cyclic nucleotide-binding domain-containing protein [Candidatus Dormibacteraeota bacterium]